MEAMQNFHLQVVDWFSPPAGIDKLCLPPWTILSYMFTHEGVWQLIGTLLWVSLGFGYILQDLTGNSKHPRLHLWRVSRRYLIYSYLEPRFLNYYAVANEAMPLIGGGAAVMAVALATTTLAPGYRIFPMLNGGIPLWCSR